MRDNAHRRANGISTVRAPPFAPFSDSSGEMAAATPAFWTGGADVQRLLNLCPASRLDRDRQAGEIQATTGRADAFRLDPETTGACLFRGAGAGERFRRAAQCGLADRQEG